APPRGTDERGRASAAGDVRRRPGQPRVPRDVHRAGTQRPRRPVGPDRRGAHRLLALVTLVSLMDPPFGAARAAMLPDVVGEGETYAVASTLSNTTNNFGVVA